VLQDLADSGLVFRAGRGPGSTYRAATDADLEHARSSGRDSEGTDTLVWALVYRLGPIDRGRLGSQVALAAHELDASLSRLVAAGKINTTHADGVANYRAHGFVVPLGEARGWEASVFDHFQAMVTTIGQRLSQDGGAPARADRVGGSTYTFEVWPGHPLEGEVLGELGRMRAHLGNLRRRVLEHNQNRTVPKERSRVVVYGGQCMISHEDSNEETNDHGF